MKGLRRSLNKDKIGAPTPTYSSLPTAGFPSTSQAAQQQQRVLAGAVAGNGGGSSAGGASTSARPSAAPAPAPPKRVIRAISDYRARTAHELSFDKGDFFHVVSDEGGDEWFDAANPMTGARGMVPAECFQVLGRNVRETQQQAQTGSLGRKTSGSTNGRGQPSPTYGAGGQSMQQQQQQPPPPHLQQQQHGRSSSQSYGPAGALKKSTNQPSAAAGLPLTTSSSSSRQSRPASQPAHKPQPLYGIVQYDFVAERADELDAKRGEPIIVIAQSNHEWFVAKPIGRLGGPGLIPVAFVEIQDMTTGKPVENVEELIRSAVVPKVEEWKKMTADYKSASIPLGRFDFASNNAPASGASQQSSPRSPADQQRYSEQQGTPFTSQSSSRPESDAYDASRGGNGDDEDDGRRYSYSRERRQYGLVTSASVESFHHEEGSYWFHLRAFFSTGASLVLYRLYQDFYDFQIALMDEFPVEAGRIPPGGEGSGQEPERILPMMPGPTDYEDEVVCAQRVHDLSLYLGDLCALPEGIRGSGLMYEFLVPRAGDVEVAQGNGRGDEPGGGAEASDGQYGELVEYLDHMDGSRQPVGGQNGQVRAAESGVEEDLSRLSIGNGAGSGGYDSYQQQSQQHQQPRTESRQSHTSSGYGGARASQQDHGAQYQQPTHSAPMGTANLNVPFIKIKIFHRNTDDLIAIRVPPTVSHTQLLDKVRERLGSEVVNLRFREEVGSSAPSGAHVVMAGGARLVGVANDEDLERWIRSGARLVLYAD